MAAFSAIRRDSARKEQSRKIACRAALSRHGQRRPLCSDLSRKQAQLLGGQHRCDRQHRSGFLQRYEDRNIQRIRFQLAIRFLTTQAALRYVENCSINGSASDLLAQNKNVSMNCANSGQLSKAKTNTFLLITGSNLKIIF